VIGINAVSLQRLSVKPLLLSLQGAAEKLPQNLVTIFSAQDIAQQYCSWTVLSLEQSLTILSIVWLMV